MARSSAAGKKKALPRRGAPDDASSGAWGEVFGDAVVAGATLERLMHKAVVFNIRGPSWRMRKHEALTEAARQ